MKYGIIPVICFLFFFFICMGEIQFWWFWLGCIIVPILIVELIELLFPKKMKKYWEDRAKEAQEKWKRTPSKYK